MPRGRCVREASRVDAPVPIAQGAAATWRRAGVRLVRDDRSWIASALAVSLLIGWGGDDASGLAWLNPVALALLLAVRWADVRRGPRRWAAPRWAAGPLVAVMGWAAGMAYEFTLAAGGDGYGGMHPDTGPSFVIAQGYYVPAALVTWWAVRRHGLDTRRAFFFAGAMAWYEALTVGAVSLISPLFVLGPALAAYYVTTYALFGMAGLLVVDHRRVARPDPRPIGMRRLLLLGALAGSACWAVFLAWSYLAAALFGFQL